MIPNLPKLLTYCLLLINLHLNAQEIWRESFSTPEKGVWGSNDSANIKTDFENVSSWTLTYSNILLNDSNDYAKTVTTSGGRFECKDINGEVIWHSEKIDISEYINISIQLNGSETGSGANESTKYLKAFYMLDNEKEKPFEINGNNTGNWGQRIVKQDGLEGNALQVVVYISNFYSADKVILDEVLVRGEERNPVVIGKRDLLINEVLFNPLPDGEDYVELYNNSKKFIPLNKLYLASRDKNLELTQIYSLTSKKINIAPENYLVLTQDTNRVFPWFTIECAACFLQMAKLPSFNNDEDYVVLLNNKMQIVDEFYYEEKMHSALLHNPEGISLERISFSGETNEKTNWHSASTTSGYGTPGYKNSQSENKDLKKVAVSFEPKSFSPNNDGYNDIYSVNFKLDKPGYICNVWVYDSAGRFITKLAENSILGTDAVITWNGTDETGNRQKPGVYIVLVEIFNTEGFLKKFKDGVVLTDMLE